MKKILMLLLAIYVSLPLIMFYKKKQYDKNNADEKWKYFTNVLIHNNSNIFDKNQIVRWDNIINISLNGNPKNEDIITLKNYINQINKLIAPKEIRLSNQNISILIYFTDEHYMPGVLKDYPYAICDINYRKEIKYKSEHESLIKKENRCYYSSPVNMYLKSDLKDQTKRNIAIIRGLTSIILGFQGDKTGSRYNEKNIKGQVILDILGNNIKIKPFCSYKFKNSIFNSNCKNCYQFSEIDKYIIKTYLSEDIDNLVDQNSSKTLILFMNSISLIHFITIILLLIILYISGFFNRTIFIPINKYINSKWLVLNAKIISLVLIYGLLNYFYLITWNSILTDKFHFVSPNIFSSIIIPIISAICIVNCIYYIEKVIFVKSEQFAIQQLFSFIILIFGQYVVFLINFFFYNRILFGPNIRIDRILLLTNEFSIIVLAFGLARFLYNYLNYQKRLAAQEKEQEITILREQKTRAELNALQSKINPHFLYNALNSIAGLAHENADKVEQMALALSKLFRYSINKDDDDFITIQNEVEMVQIYLDIEKVRFGDKLQYQVNIEKGLEDQRIPKFIIQPLVENAIKHGISKIVDHGLLKLDIYKIEDQLHIRVSDNGADFPEDIMTGYGLQNIYEKLDILYSNRYEVLLQNGKDKNISVILK